MWINEMLQVLWTAECSCPWRLSRPSLLLEHLIKEIHRVLQAGRDGSSQLYNPVIFQMGNWDTGKRRNQSRSCGQLVSELWSRQTGSSFSGFLTNFLVSFLFHCCFHSIPFQLAPDCDQATILASILTFGYNNIVGFPYLKSRYFLSGVDLDLFLQRF